MDRSEVAECTMEEYSHADLDGAGLPPEVDGALLIMDLLEDSPAPDQPEDVDRLSHVIRSLEAEIGGGPAAAGDGEDATPGPSDDDGELEDMLSDFDRYEGGAGGPMDYWPEMAVAHHDMAGWYVDGEGGIGAVGYEVRDQYYVEGSVEQAYSPLWE